MKILILGSVALPVPPPMQGGTERIAYWQAIGLSKKDHQITLVAAKGSTPNQAYTLVEIGGGDTVTGSRSQQDQQHKQREQDQKEFTEGSRNLRKEAIYLAEVEQYILDHGKEFDVIVNNMRAGETLFVPAAKAVGVPYVTVMHLPMFSELADYFHATNTSVITISNAQRAGFDQVRYAGTVYNCVEPELLQSSVIASKTKQSRDGYGIAASPNGGTRDDKYLLMMGSVAPHKNQKDGILAAKAAGKTIILAGKIGNQGYWDTEIAPLVDGKTVIHKGEMGLEEKIALLSNAEALLFPIVWPEPFGLVMIEAMACGTPVIAYKNGAVPEVIDDGKTGFIIDEAQGIGGLSVAISRIGEIDRVACRNHVQDTFTVEKMIDSLDQALQQIK